jgi:hypothetical protein
VAHPRSGYLTQRERRGSSRQVHEQPDPIRGHCEKCGAAKSPRGKNRRPERTPGDRRRPGGEPSQDEPRRAERGERVHRRGSRQIQVRERQNGARGPAGRTWKARDRIEEAVRQRGRDLRSQGREQTDSGRCRAPIRCEASVSAQSGTGRQRRPAWPAMPSRRSRRRAESGSQRWPCPASCGGCERFRSPRDKSTRRAQSRAR